jgi:hypothetical protein
MESTLHRQLKLHYGGSADDVEVQVDGFRIDAVVRGRLFEIQQASLGALRDKVRRLLERHKVVVVKPLVCRKYLVRRDHPGGDIVSQRYSPLRESVLNVFQDLVHFVTVFPHPRLTLEVVLVEVEEDRITRPRRRRRGPDFRVADRRLTKVVSTTRLKTIRDMQKLLPGTLPSRFTTEDLAREAAVPRWLAQKMAYCLRTAGAIEAAGKQGNCWQYRLAPRRKRAA